MSYQKNEIEMESYDGKTRRNNESTESTPLIITDNHRIKLLTQIFSYSHSPLISRSLFANEFIRGIKNSLDFGWLPLFYFLLMRDLIAYDQDLNAHDLGNIFSGSSKNQQSWSSQLGGDIVGVRFCLTFSTLILLPIMSGFFSQWLHRHWHKLLTTAEYSVLINNVNNGFWLKKNVIHITAFGVGVIEKNITFDTQSSILTIREMAKIIENETNPSTYQCELLAKLITRIERIDLEQNSNIDRLSYIRLTRDRALHTLKVNPLDGTSVLQKIYANYILWTLGAVQDKRKHILFGFLNLLGSGLKFYAYYRYARTLVEMSLIYNQFVFNHEECTNQSMLWQYMSQLGEYNCVVCDWSFVSLTEMYSTQGCINGLLRSSQNISQYLEDVQKFVNLGGIKSIDLTHRKVSDWSETEFANFLTAFSKLTSLQSFNLSNARFNTVWPPDNKMKLLRQFSRHTPINHLDLSGQKMGPDNLNEFLSERNSTVFPEYFNVSENNLGDQGLVYLGSAVSNHEMKNLIVANNNFTAEGISQFSPHLINSTLQELCLSRISVDQQSFDDLIEGVSQSQIKIFDISHSDLTDIDLSSVGQLLPSSQVETVKWDDCKIDDIQTYQMAPIFKNSRLKSMSVASNSLTDEGGVKIINAAQNSSLTEINLSGNRLSDLFIESIQNELPNLKLKYFDLSGISFSSDLINNLIENLPPTIETINFSSTEFNDLNIQTLIKFMRSHNQLTTLILNDTPIKDPGIIKLSVLIKENYPIKAVYLRNTYIINQGLKEISKWFATNNHLKILDISGIYGDNIINNAAEFARGLENCTAPLQELYIDNIPFFESGSIIASQLIKPINNISQLRNADLSLSLKRALGDSQPSLPLTTVSMKNCNLTTESLRVICRVEPHTHIPATQFHLENNPHYEVVDFNKCAISSSNKLKPWFSLNIFKDAVSYLKSKVSNFNSQNYFSKQMSTYVNITSNPSITPDNMNYLTRGNKFTPLKSINNTESFANFGGALFLSAYLMHFIGIFSNKFYSDNSCSLTTTERQLLDNLQKDLPRLKRILNEQYNSSIGKSGVITDKVVCCKEAMIFLEKTIAACMKNNVIRPSELNDIKQKFDQINLFIKRNTHQNKLMKKFRLTEKRIERRNQRSGEVSFSVVTENIMSGDLRQDVINQYAMDLQNIDQKKSMLETVSHWCGFWKTQVGSDSVVSLLPKNHIDQQVLIKKLS